MLRFMPAKLVHKTHRCKFVGQTANYGDIRLCVWTKCKGLGRMTKQKSAEQLAGIKYYTYLCRKTDAYIALVFGICFFFYMNEHEPIHVHISYGGKKAKIELSPAVRVIYNHGIKEQVMKKAINTCNNYREEFIEEWHKCFD